MTATLLKPRPYQSRAVDAAFDAWGTGMRRPAELFPTGTGKTVIFSHLGVRYRAENPGKRVLVLAHTTELVDQAIEKFRAVAPGMSVGRVQANVNETLAPIICASVPTLRTEARRRMIRNVGLVIVDECHHAVAPTYRTILEHFGALGPLRPDSAVAIGFTATMERGDDLRLGDIWQDVVASMSLVDAIAGGYLVRPHGKYIEVPDLDLSRVHTSRGDFREDELGAALEDSMAPEAIAKAINDYAPNRTILLFAPTVSSAQRIGKAIELTGRKVGHVNGSMSKESRREVLDDFRNGRIQILTNCQVLTEGFDFPPADCAVLARPTRSPVLYKQIAGRVLRPAPGKTDALLLDVVGASLVHSLITGVTLFGDDPEEKAKRKRRELDDDLAADLPLLPPVEPAREWTAKLHHGPLEATEVDLFASSPAAWLRTRAGVFFLSAGDRYIAILPAAPQSEDQWMSHFAGRRIFLGYDVWVMPKKGEGIGTSIIKGVQDLSYAMAWAEAEVTPAEKMTASKDRAWRARQPSAATLGLARSLGIEPAPGAQQGEVSNMITLAQASGRIDRELPQWVR